MWVALSGFALILAAGRWLAVRARGRAPQGEPCTVDGETLLVQVGTYKGRVMRVSVCLITDSDLFFQFQREQWFDRLAKTLGISREFQTGDTPFDQRVYLQTEDPALHVALQFNTRLREALLGLMQDPKTRRIGAAARRLWLETSDYNGRDTSEKSGIAMAAARRFRAGLCAIRTELAGIRTSEPAADRDPTPIKQRRFLVAFAGCIAAGTVGWLYAWRHSDHQIVQVTAIKAGWLLMVAMAVGFVVALRRVHGRAAISHRALLDIILIVLPGAWVAGYGVAMACNRTLDHSVARRVHVPIESAYEYRRRRSHGWILKTSHWPDARGQYKVELTREEFALMSMRSCVDALWHPGWLGDGWIERYAPHDEGECEPGIPP